MNVQPQNWTGESLNSDSLSIKWRVVNQHSLVFDYADSMSAISIVPSQQPYLFLRLHAVTLVDINLYNFITEYIRNYIDCNYFQCRL